MTNNGELKIFKLGEFIKQDFPKRNCIMSPIIHEKSLNMLYAPRGVGKTMLALAIAHCIATGNKLLKWEAETPAKVLYVDGEMPIESLQERLIRTIKGNKSDIENLNNFILLPSDYQEDTFLNIANEASQKMIEKIIEDEKIKFVVLDNLSTLSNTRENEADDWFPIQEWLLKLRRNGVAVLLVHHAGKGGQQRGTSRREDVLDTVINLSKIKGEKSKLRLSFEKSRNIPEDNLNLEVELRDGDDDSLIWEYLDMDELMDNLQAQGMSCREIAEMTGKSKSTVNRKLKK